MHSFGHPLGPIEGEHNISLYSNDDKSISTLVSNVTRNLGIHLGSLPDPAGKMFTDAVISTHSMLDIPVNGANNTWPGTSFTKPDFIAHEDLSGNPFHGILMLCFIVVCLLIVRSTASSITVGLILSFVSFCFFLKWQPWHSRLHLPFFVAGSWIVAAVLEKARSRILVVVMGLILAYGSIPYWLENQLRPMVGESSIFRTDYSRQYFAARPGLAMAYKEIRKAVKKHPCRRYGLVSNEDEWEYPIMTQEWQYISTIAFHPQEAQMRYLHGLDRSASDICGVLWLGGHAPAEITLSHGIFIQKLNKGAIALFQ